MLNKIEKGADWPEHMYQTRAVFLSKDHNQTSNPLCYRILKITSIWYRKWGSTRMRDLDVWVNGWNVPELFSGVPEKGAQDAWFQTALFNELGLLKGRDISGASIDVYKCFDQIDRDLAKEILRMSGMPKRVLHPYFNCIDNLNVRFQVGKNIGKEHKDIYRLPPLPPTSQHSSNRGQEDPGWLPGGCAVGGTP
jgi:hypothetical protein